MGQVNANNVQTVTSTGDAIQGTFRHQVAYPPGTADARQVQQFTTQRPTFADDNLFQRLQANGVTVNANAPSQGTPTRSPPSSAGCGALSFRSSPCRRARAAARCGAAAIYPGPE